MKHRLEPRHDASPGACFIAGTPVWTDRGLVPIGQLKAGDQVLSQSEETGERAYRRIMRTSARGGQAIMSLRYCLPPPDDTVIHYQYVTSDQLFWVKGAGWTRAYLFEGGEELELPDGGTAYALGVVPVYGTDRPGVGWMPEYSHSVDGFEIDFSEGHDRWLDDEDQQNYGKSPAQLLVTVNNIEVEGFHTYYVGELGVWVHSGDCAVHPPFSADAPGTDKDDSHD